MANSVQNPKTDSYDKFQELKALNEWNVKKKRMKKAAKTNQNQKAKEYV